MQQTVGGEADELKALYLSVSQFAQSLEPKAVTGADATVLHNYASRIEGVAATIKGLALMRIDETDAYKFSGHRSAADYGASKTGTSPSDAQRTIKRARNARRLPKTDDAMRNGDISPQQADAITDAARINPDAEDDLLRSAKRDDLGTLKRKAKQAKFRADRDAAERARRLHRERSLRHWTDDDGAFHAHLKTTPEAGARFLARLEPHRRAAFERARREGRREDPGAYAADAFDDLISGTADQTAEPTAANSETGTTAARAGTSPRPAETPLFDRDGRSARPGDPSEAAGTSEHGDSGDRSPPGPPSPPSGSSRSAPRDDARAKSPPPAVTAHLFVDLAALRRGHLEPGEICEIAGIGPIDLATARAMLGDANVKLLLKQGDDIRTVIHTGRSVTARQRSALIARDPCCVVPGCGRTHNLEIDHREGWSITHTTSLDDLARLCRWHHYLKTHCGFTYSGGPGTWAWHPPDEQAHVEVA